MWLIILRIKSFIIDSGMKLILDFFFLLGSPYCCLVGLQSSRWPLIIPHHFFGGWKIIDLQSICLHINKNFSGEKITKNKNSLLFHFGIICLKSFLLHFFSFLVISYNYTKLLSDEAFGSFGSTPHIPVYN